MVLKWLKDKWVKLTTRQKKKEDKVTSSPRE